MIDSFSLNYSGSLYDKFINFSFFNYSIDLVFLDWSTIFFYKGSFITLGFLLYNFFFVQFLIAGLTLFVGMLGAIVLTLTQFKLFKKQVSFKQLIRNHFTIFSFKF